MRERHLRVTYGLSLDGFNKLFESQGKCCAICKTTDPGKNNWAVDHNHEFGFVRYIVCNNCNAMLGYSKENPDILRRAAQYLEMQFIV